MDIEHIDVEISEWSLGALRALATESRSNAAERQAVQEERRPKGKLRYPALDPEALWAEFESKTQDGRKVQIRWWRESDNALLEGEAVEEHIRAVTVYCQTHRPAAENENYLWAYEVHSGLSPTRPIGDAVLDMMATGMVAALIVPRKDRWNRNVEFNERSKRIQIESDTPLCSVHELVDLSTPSGRLFDTLLTAIGQYDAEMGKMKMYAGRVAAIRNKGVYLGSESPYGYAPISYRGRGQRGVLEVCPFEARVVKLIFKLRRRGYRPHQIAAWLNRMGLVTRKGKRWTWVQVTAILQHEAQYRAEALWHWVDGEPQCIAHPPILPHRDNNGERTYVCGGYMVGTSERRGRRRRPVWKMVSTNDPAPLMRTDMAIPDDPEAEPIKLAGKRRPMRVDLSRDQAQTIALLYRMIDGGQGNYAIAKQLNEWGLPTFGGKMWSPRNVAWHRAERPRNHYTALFKAMGLHSICLAVSAEHRVPTLAEERERFLAGKRREQEAKAMMTTLRADNPKMSLREIADRVNAAGLLTVNGCQWYPAGVSRVLKGCIRATDLASRERRLLANSVHDDGSIRVERM